MMTSLFRSELADRDSQGFGPDDFMLTAVAGSPLSKGLQPKHELRHGNFVAGRWQPHHCVVASFHAQCRHLDRHLGRRCIETVTGETDSVKSSVSWTLGDLVENLELTDSWNLTDSSDIDGTGNSLANVITGNYGSNVLDGGSRVDTLRGGYGNDTYVVDNVNDELLENYAYGTDVVLASVSFALQAEIENLTLTGTSAINGTGNSLVNVVIIGNSASNVLNGGTGADSMRAAQATIPT